MDIRRRKLKEELRSSWFLPLRLTIFLLLFGAVVFAGGSGSQLFTPFLLYSLATILLLALIELNVRFIKPWMLAAVIFCHLGLELIVEGMLVEGTEHLASQYSVLFLLSIVSASLAYRLAGTLFVASLASLVFTMKSSLSALLAGSPLTELQRLSQSIAESDDVFYGIFLHVCTFFMVAFISGFLSEKLRAKEGELSSTSRRLERAQLDTDDILANLHSGILTVDSRGDIVYFNRAAEVILGFCERDIKGKSFMQVFNRQIPEFAERILSVLKLAEPSIRTELEFTNQAGTRIPLGLTTSVLGDEQVGIRGVIAIFQDLTAAKQLENALMRADRLAVVGELSARIAHEIRNPLASISGSVEVLKSELALEGENQRLMDLIVKESERLSRILSDFLSYARNKPTVRSRLELVSVVSETIELLRHNLTLPESVEINLKTDHTTVYIVGDEDQLRQMVINLVGNAVEALAHRQGRIEVVISEPDTWPEINVVEWIGLEIADNGCGFDPKKKEKIFEPFFSLKKGGTGLGLAIVRRCADSLGARIRVETQPDKGTRFSLIFRRHLTQPHPSREARQSDGSQSVVSR